MRILHGLFSLDYQTFDQNHHRTTTNFIRHLPTTPSIVHLLGYHLVIIRVLTPLIGYLQFINPSITNQSPSILNLFIHPDCTAVS